MKNWPNLVLASLALSLFVFLCVPAFGREISVSLVPSDRAVGCGSGKADYCLNSLSDLENLLAKLSAGADNDISGVTVNFSRGRYLLDHPLLISWNKPTVNGDRAFLVLQAREGGVEIVGSEFVKPSDVVNREPFGEHRELVTFLSSGSSVVAQSFGFGVPKPEFGQVLLDDYSAQLSKLPRNGYLRFNDFAETAKGYLLSAGIARPVAYKTLIRAFPGNDWADFNYVAEFLRFGRMSLLGKSKYGLKVNARFQILNHEDGLADVGDWFVEQGAAANKYHVVVPVGYSSSKISISRLSNLLRIKNSERVTVSGINFRGASGSAVKIDNSGDIVLSNINIFDVGGLGVEVMGAYRTKIEGARISRVGLGGISFAGGDRQTLEPSLSLIENNKVNTVGRWLSMYQPAIYIKGVGISVIGNYLNNLSHSALIFEGNNHVISKNIIDSTNLESGDSGAIYSGRDWTARGNLISSNYIGNVGAAPIKGEENFGVYLDDQVSGERVSNNFISSAQGGVFIGGGSDNAVVGNDFRDIGQWYKIDARGMNWQRVMSVDPNGQLQKFFVQFARDNAKYRSSYPGLDFIAKGNYGIPHGNVISDNFIEGEDRGSFFKSDPKFYNFSEFVLLSNNRFLMRGARPEFSIELLRRDPLVACSLIPDEGDFCRYWENRNFAFY